MNIESEYANSLSSSRNNKNHDLSNMYLIIMIK